MVLETGGSPLGFTWDKALWRKKRVYNQCCVDTNCGAWRRAWRTTTGKNVGWEKRKKQVRSSYYKLAVKGRYVYECLGVVQPQAPHSTRGTTAKREWGKAAALRGEESETTKRERERESGCLTGLWVLEGWRWRICVNESVPHKPQFPLLSYQSYPEDNAAQTEDKEGTGQQWRVARKHLLFYFSLWHSFF